MNCFILKKHDNIEGNIISWHKNDARYQHFTQILKGQVGSSYKACYHKQPMGSIFCTQIDEQNATFTYHEGEGTQLSPTYPIKLFIGVTRPPTSERLIRDLSAIGIESLTFFACSLSEKSYLQSKIWQAENIQRNIELGMQQGGTSFPLQVSLIHSFHDLNTHLAQSSGENYLLDQQLTQASYSLKQVLHTITAQRTTNIVIGPERGLSEKEHASLGDSCHKIYMGNRILRTENIATAISIALVSSLNETQSRD